MDEVVHTSPTIGSNVEEIVCKKSRFVMWDIGGQESLRSSWSTYYANSDVSQCIVSFKHFELLCLKTKISIFSLKVQFFCFHVCVTWSIHVKC